MQLTALAALLPIPFAIQSYFSSSSAAPKNMPQFPANPEWKTALTTALASQPATFFQLATVSAPLVPRCRTLTYGGFFGETPYKPASEIPAAARNQSVVSDVLYVASDARSSKFDDLRVSQNVEAVIFFPALWSQYRIRGRAFPISTGAQGGDVEALGRRLVESHLAKTDEAAQWEWEAELKKIYERQDQHLIKDKFPPPVRDSGRVV